MLHRKLLLAVKGFEMSHLLTLYDVKRSTLSDDDDDVCDKYTRDFIHCWLKAHLEDIFLQRAVLSWTGRLQAASILCS